MEIQANKIIMGKAPITPETALQLERVLGIPAGFWNNREHHYREALARMEEQSRLQTQRRRIFKGTQLLALLFGVCLTLSCGEAQKDRSGAFRVVMVTDVGGIGDKGFNDSGWAGVQRAVTELGVRADLIQSREQADYVQNLSLAGQNADVVVAMGYLMIDAVREAARLHPRTEFVFVDGAVEAPNVESFDFKAQEASYLAGILAAGVSRTGTVGAVLGMEIPPVRAYEAGFRAGILTMNARRGSRVRCIGATAGDFNDPVKGKSLAEALIGKGADILIQIAGNTGVGVLEAVKEAPEGTYAIGVDIDQDELVKGRVLVSVLKRIDNAVFQAIQDAKRGEFRPGHRWIGVAEGATGLTQMRHTRHLVPREVLEMAERAEAMIRDGRLAVPSRLEDLEGFVPPDI